MTTRNASHPTSDREALSALFDGELTGDAARFALKRLDHDQDWRDTCERWRIFGEALRGQDALLPAAFPARVRDAMRADGQRSRAGATARTGRFQWASPRWGSVALAASAAVVAFFLARTPSPETPSASTPQVAAAAQPAPSTPAPQPQAPASNAPASQTPGTPSGVEAAGAAFAVAAVARPASQRTRNLQRDRAATDRVVSSVVAARAPATETAMPATTVADRSLAARPDASDAPLVVPTDPFAGAAESRPWPRAVLPQLSGNGTLAADYATTPSFYPFAPRDAAGAPAEATAPATPATEQAPPAPSPP